MSQLDGINEREFEQILGDSEGQGSLACCSPQGCKVSETTEPLNNNCVNKNIFYKFLRYKIKVSVFFFKSHLRIV